MTSLQHRDVLAIANVNGDLRHQLGELRVAGQPGAEDRLHPVGLRPYAIDGYHLGAIGELVDVVRLLVARVGRGKEHASLALHWHQVLLEHKRHRSLWIRPALDGVLAQRHTGVSSVTVVIARAWFSLPGQPRNMRKCLV